MLLPMQYPWHLTVNWNVPKNNMNKIRQARQNLNSAKGNRLRRRTVVHTLYGKLSNAAILRMFNVKRKRLRMKALINHNKKR